VFQRGTPAPSVDSATVALEQGGRVRLETSRSGSVVHKPITRRYGRKHFFALEAIATRHQALRMTVAILSGATSGALHAVTGPDHLLSLGPAVLRAPRAASRIGLLWGAGHAMGTLLLALPLLALAQLVQLSLLASAGNRVAGAALLATAAWSWRSARTRVSPTDAETRSPLWVGLLHGVTGASALLLVLPSALGGGALRSVIYLVAFALGSMFAMAALTHTLGRLGGLLEPRVVAKAQRALLVAAALLGSFWLLFG
jgi:nickel/cobalt transporter (NicO) family protein